MVFTVLNMTLKCPKKIIDKWRLFKTHARLTRIKTKVILLDKAIHEINILIANVTLSSNYFEEQLHSTRVNFIQVRNYWNKEISDKELHKPKANILFEVSEEIADLQESIYFLAYNECIDRLRILKQRVVNLSKEIYLIPKLRSLNTHVNKIFTYRIWKECNFSGGINGR